LDHTAYITLPELSLPLGPNGAVLMHLAGPILLEVEFTYEPGYPGRPASASGDPGDPGLPEEFDFKHVRTQHPLVLTSPDSDIRTVISAGHDLFEHLTALQLLAIETELVQRRRDSRLDAKVDEAIVARAMGYLGDVA
jgi:hypothetical protein